MAPRNTYQVQYSSLFQHCCMTRGIREPRHVYGTRYVNSGACPKLTVRYSNNLRRWPHVGWARAHRPWKIFRAWLLTVDYSCIGCVGWWCSGVVHVCFSYGPCSSYTWSIPWSHVFTSGAVASFLDTKT